ncbi:hypothetical protein HYX19_03005 [Candidatus Woesearchaeota archaeon]|nr:hypothetical protein [Candidatus Woesearchaeota archaeon]
MLSREEKNAIVNKIKTLKEEVVNIKKELNAVNDLKENSFRKHKGFRDNLLESIKKIKELKSKNDGFNSEVENLKKERDRHNALVKEFITKIKDLDRQKEDVLVKNNIKIPPSRLKEDIERLESSIETEAYSFDKELKVMKRIKELKSLYNKTSVLNDILEEMDKTSRMINENRSVADDHHKKIIQLINENKKSFDDFIGLSREIELLKQQQNSAFEEFKNQKSKFIEINNRLKEKLLDISVFQSKINEVYNEMDFNRKEKQESIIKERAKHVEEKISKRQKLTTEDLIFFQGSSS